MIYFINYLIFLSLKELKFFLMTKIFLETNFIVVLKLI